jgi:hypothetical protein
VFVFEIDITAYLLCCLFFCPLDFRFEAVYDKAGKIIGTIVYNKFYASPDGEQVPIILQDLTQSRWYKDNVSFNPSDEPILDTKCQSEPEEGRKKFRAMGLVGYMMDNIEFSGPSFLTKPEDLDPKDLQWADFEASDKAHDLHLAANHFYKSNERDSFKADWKKWMDLPEIPPRWHDFKTGYPVDYSRIFLNEKLPGPHVLQRIIEKSARLPRETSRQGVVVNETQGISEFLKTLPTEAAVQVITRTSNDSALQRAMFNANQLEDVNQMKKILEKKLHVIYKRIFKTVLKAQEVLKVYIGNWCFYIRMRRTMKACMKKCISDWLAYNKENLK